MPKNYHLTFSMSEGNFLNAFNLLAKGFNAAASETRCKGFAIGRSIFIEPAEDWFARRADDEQTIMRIAEKFTSIVKAWRKYRTV